MPHVAGLHGMTHVVYRGQVSKSFEVCLFFSSALGEELRTDDVAVKFGIPLRQVGSMLRAVTNSGLLIKTRRYVGEASNPGVFYSAGPALKKLMKGRMNDEALCIPSQAA